MPLVPLATRIDRAYRRERLVHAYQGGEALPVLAERFGYSMDHAYRIVRVAGVSRSKRAGRRA